VMPKFLSEDRMAFQLSGFSGEPESVLESDQVIADLLNKFHGWNYIESSS
jgi:hypothetical protein